MKKYKKKWFKSFIFRCFAGLIALVLLIVLPAVGLVKNNNLELIYERFIGAKSEYQGIIEIWNIDTFEGGISSKSKMLSQVATKFQTQNKGIYFMVRNISESECKNLLSSGQKPDLFSCSYGVAEMIKSEASSFDFEPLIANNLKVAGRDEFGVQKAVAWCLNVYCLMTTNDRLEKVGKDANCKLIDVVFDCGYKTTNKQGEKIVWSVEFGCGKYLMPQKALIAYYNNGGVSIFENSINGQNVNQTTYSAYCNFVAGKSSVLLGTLRDVLRLKNRETNGKISDLKFEVLTSFSDLVQFVLKCDDGNKTKQKYVDEFVKFLTGEVGQQIVCDGGLVSVIDDDKNLKKSGVMQDIPPLKIESYEVFNVFLSKSEIEKLQRDLLIF